MQINFDAEQLTHLLAAITKWIPTKSELNRGRGAPHCLLDVRNDVGTFSIAGHDCWIDAAVPVRSSSARSALFTPKEVLQGLKGCEGRATVTIDGRKVSFRTDNRDVASDVQSSSPSSFPQSPTLLDPEQFSVDSWEDVIGVAKAACTKRTRPILESVLFDGVGRIAATDSYSLYAVDGATDHTGEAILVPAKFLRTLHRSIVMDSTVETYAGFVKVTGELRKAPGVQVTAVCRLAGGEFPMWESLISSDPTLVLPVTADLVGCVKNLGRSSEAPVRISVSPEGFGKVSVQTGEGTLEGSLNFEGVSIDEEIAVTFNSQRLTNLLEVGGRLEVDTPLKPVVQRDRTTAGHDRLKLLIPSKPA